MDEGVDEGEGEGEGAADVGVAGVEVGAAGVISFTSISTIPERVFKRLDDEDPPFKMNHQHQWIVKKRDATYWIQHQKIGSQRDLFCACKVVVLLYSLQLPALDPENWVRHTPTIRKITLNSNLLEKGDNTPTHRLPELC